MDYHRTVKRNNERIMDYLINIELPENAYTRISLIKDMITLYNFLVEL